jgi:small subunit ribosomal protein S17
MEENIESVAGGVESEEPVNPQIKDAVTQPDVKVLGGGPANGASPATRNRRQEKVGLVTSDKMQKTVVVRVERQVRHTKYRRYIRKRTKFMAHDELGARVGDIVRIIETRPLSARKRWRVVEIVQKGK